ncbi:MAG: type II secretion system secretin GspD [Thermodesulfobacteriota bacterium]|nr:type II secretion system secretin GspD [Thermodesulfobacteriota bacterium]
MFNKGKQFLIFHFLGAVIFCLLFQGPGLAGDQTTDLDQKKVSIDFNNVDITVFIKFFSELTGKNFVIDRRVKGAVTIISPSKISIQKAWQVFESVLDIHGFTAVESGNVYKVIPTPEARSQNIDTGMAAKGDKSEDRIVTRIIPLEFADAAELNRLFTPLVSRGSVVLPYSDTNMLIITDTQANINRLLKIVQAVDVRGMGRKITVIPLENADAGKMVKHLSSIFTARTRGRASTQNPELMVEFVADERTNAIVLLASEIETERVKELVALLDREVPKGEEKIRVYYLEHASAENLAQVLQDTLSFKPAIQNGKKHAPIVSDNMKINADKATNSLIIMAEKEDYPVIEEVIAKLDIPRAMVYIECLIMEVNIAEGLDLGTEWRAGESFDEDSSGEDQGVYFGGFGSSGYSRFNSIASTGSLPSGFSIGVMGETLKIGDVIFPSLGAVVQAYETNKNVNILSTPQILTTDNEEASIKVGKNVPYQTRSAAENATDTYSSYEYKDVGITLKITPQISKDRLVRMKVYQEITKLDSVNQSSNDRPTTLKRLIETTIIVKNENTVVIGGLIDTSLSASQHSVPCLGDIPGLGYLFKSVSQGNDRTNLYVFLTPRVLKSPVEAADLYQIKKEDIQTLEQGEVKLYRHSQP